uniref:NADH dehydrogenase subunit 2 n=1 Tax=Xylonora corona TaxID=2939326 RepID=UPI002027D098|nr:NADH dehydrogenase subunit 2 [Xylonora corona]UPX88875.1 NADH dehydrogenase subunit 2 [Xylonora corona]
MVLKFIRFNPAFFFFFFLMVGSVILVIFSGGLLGVWVGLECGFLGVVSILCGESVAENESCMQYFVFQSIGAGFLFFSFVLLEIGSVAGVAWVLFFLGFSLKLGLFPFHFWVPSVLSKSSWVGCFVVSTWQKIPPLLFLSGAPLWGGLEVLACMTGILGGLGGLGLLHYRSLLGYSSLIHTSWMVLVSGVSVLGLVFYVIIYSVVLGQLMKNLFSSKIFSLLDFNGAKIPSSGSSALVFMDFISLAGVPPLLGSLPKIVSVLLCWEEFWVGVIVLIGCSMMSLFYYLSVIVIAGGLTPSGLGSGASSRVSLFFVGLLILLGLGFGA